MKRILLSALFIVPTMVIAQVTIIDENFDGYSDQDYAGDVSSVMSTWSGSTGVGTDDCQVTSAQSSSPSNSITITGPQAGGTIDAMVQFPSDYTSGRFDYTMKYMVAAGMGGYFNLQTSGATPGTGWITEIYFAADGTGAVNAAGQQVAFSYTNGAWIDVRCEVDIDGDIHRVWIEGVEIGAGYAISMEADGTGTGANMSFGGVNLYSASGDAVADCEYYVDDVMLVETTGVGLEESNLNPSMNVVPNPSEGNFVLNYADMSLENATVSVVDVLGKTIFSKEMDVIGNASMSFDMNLRNGVYFVTIADSKTKMTKKVIVRK
jgi:Secretion system C-terminal sorting domain